MSKIEEAREILKELQVPAKQQADLCCYVLLAMSDIKEDDEWSSAVNGWIRIHDVIAYTKENYGVAYAENSRELCTILGMLRLLRIMEKRPIARTIAIV